MIDSVHLPSVVLIMMLIWTALIVHQAQKRTDFDWGEALRDDKGKLSALRLGVFVSLVISSWSMVVAMLAVRAAADLDHVLNIFLAYIGVWSGAKVVEKGIDLFASRIKP